MIDPWTRYSLTKFILIIPVTRAHMISTQCHAISYTPQLQSLFSSPLLKTIWLVAENWAVKGIKLCPPCWDSSVDWKILFLLGKRWRLLMLDAPMLMCKSIIKFNIGLHILDRSNENWRIGSSAALQVCSPFTKVDRIFLRSNRNFRLFRCFGSSQPVPVPIFSPLIDNTSLSNF